MKPQADIHLQIEELVLHGFAPGDKHAIGEAVERELTRLISEQPLSPRENISSDRIDVGSFQIKKSAQPTQIGEQIAGAIHGGLGR
jgi:hypothetical protein